MPNTPAPLSGDSRTIAKEELDIHYDQLKSLDDNLYKYSSVFFTISAALLAFLAQLLARDPQHTDPIMYLLLCFLGYAAAVCILLIALKAYYTWEIKDVRVRELEGQLGYRVHQAYTESPLRQMHWATRYLSISRIRLVFNLLLGIIWVVLILSFPRLTVVNIHPLLFVPLYSGLIFCMILIPLVVIGSSYLIDRPVKGKVLP